MSSSTTQILFNSPALRSLKREQLIKLCKIHSLKTSGKNGELVEKLKQHAFTLPRDSPLSVAARSEDAFLPPHTSELLFSERQRPSEQWEVVMDSIDEAEETAASQGSLNSQRTVSQDKAAGEFGTASSKSSVGSSLMALATSLGLKRPDTTSFRPTPSVKSHVSTTYAASDVQEANQLTRSATPYSHLSPAISGPQSDLIPSKMNDDGLAADVDMQEPVPGDALRPGAPAPVNARLSMDLTGPQTPSKQTQPTTTIRLVQNSESMGPSTPQLAPFKTTFDLITSPGTAAGIGFGTFGSTTTQSSSIYPSLPTDINELAIGEAPAVNMATDTATGVAGADEDVTMPGAFSSPSPQASPTIAANAKMAPLSSSNALEPPKEPFIFGSPLPKYRVSDAQFREAAAGVLDEMNKRLQAEGVGVVDTDIIKRLHPGSHAEGIQTSADHGSSECQTSRIKEMFDKKHQAEFEKMEGIDALVKRKAAKLHGHSKQGSNDKVVAGKKRKSSVLIDEPRRIPSQVASRTSGTKVISIGRRSRMIPGAFDNEDFDHETGEGDERGKKKVKGENGAVHDAESQAQREKERDAIRRKLELSKAKRRSSRQSGRVSVGRVQQKQKPSRFGFLAQAKSIVQSMFGRSKTSSVMAPTASSKAKGGRQDPEPTTKKLPMASSSISSMDNSRPMDSMTRNTSSKASLGSRASTLDKEQRCSSSVRSQLRSPIPPFTGSTTSTTRIANVTQPSASVASMPSRSNSASSDISSIGPKPPAGQTKIPSMGTSKPVGSFGVKKAGDKGQSSLSRLHAPTASSLAKMGRCTSFGTTSSLRDNKQNAGASEIKKDATLSSITNNIAHEAIAARGPTSLPASGQIFNKPLKPVTIGGTGTIEGESHGSNLESGVTTKHSLQRQRTLSGRKPRISRSKVISRLASQRADATKSDEPATGGLRQASATRKPLSVRRTRSSLSAKVKKPIGRSSHTGVGVSNGASDLLMSAKKRARQSEYQARRRSQMETGAIKQSVA